MDIQRSTFHLERAFRLASFLVISMAVLFLYGFTAYHALLIRPWGDVAVAVVIVGFLYSMVLESRKLIDTDEGAMGPMLCIKSFVCVILGASIAFTLKVDLGLGAVLAASLVSLLAAILVPAYGVPIALGGFVGMTSSRLLVSHLELSYAAAIAGVVYLCTDRVFNGFGGKLGTIAFVGTFITGMGLSREFIMTPFPEWEIIGIIILVSIISVVLTYWLSVYRSHGPVISSGVVGIAAGLLLPHYFPGDKGQTLAVMAMCASYAGMTGKARISNLYLMALVGLLCGLIFIFSMPLAGGAGGKLGTIAFGTVLAVRGYVDMLKKLKILV